MGFVWQNETKPSSSPSASTIEILYIYDDSGTADDDMRLNDTGTKGASEFATAVNAMTDGNSNSYNITEIAESTFIFNVSNNLSGIDILITGSAIDDYTGQPATDLETFVETDGKGILMYSDGSLGGGADNQVGADSRRSMGCMDWGFDCAVDQKEGVTDDALPSSSIWGNALQYQGEGSSPWVLDQNSGNHASQGNPTVLTARSSQSLSKTTGLTYTGTVAEMAYSTPGSGRVAFIYDRQLVWNSGSPGAAIDTLDNEEILLNIIRWLAQQPLL